MSATKARRAVALLATITAFVLAACGSAASPTPTPTTGSAAAEQLAATIPTTVGDLTLTVRQASLDDLADVLPSYGELIQALNNAFVNPDQVLVAIAADPTRPDDLQIAALRIVGATGGAMTLAMQAWGTDAGTVEQVNVGQPATKVTPSDGSAPVYYFLHADDTLYFVRTDDEALAEQALAALP
jgi:hypothetical protein